MEKPITKKKYQATKIFSNIEFFCLCFLALTLPLLEAPKNIACLLYLLVWIARLSITGISDIKTTSYDLIIAVFLGSNIIASLAAQIKGYETSDLTDIIRYSLVGWMLLHTSLSKKQIFIIMALLLLSALLGVAWGYWDLWEGTNTTLKLHSVGHVNHSSIYLLLIIGGLLPFLLHNKWNRWEKTLTGIFLLILLTALFETHSRATIIGFVFILILLFGVSLYHHKKLATLTLAVTIGFGAYSIWNTPPVINKFISKAKAYDNQLSPREKIWNVAIAVWKKEPVFGIGYGSYRTIDAARMQTWHESTDQKFNDSSQYLYFPHAHNRYLHTLTEGGLAGLFGLMFFLIGSTILLLKKRAALSRPGDDLSFWLIGFNALSITAIVGLFNTTLHHEHGLLSMMLLLLSYKGLSSNIEKSNQS